MASVKETVAGMVDNQQDMYNFPYIRFDDLRSAKEILPPGSDVEVIEGGAHAVLIEEPYYRDFQNRLVRFLEKE